MSELNEIFEETLIDTDVITVPIDTTLTHSGEAAEAKAVGDALALKADKSELQAAISVNGQTADAQGAILLNAGEIPMTDAQGSDTVYQAVQLLDNKTGQQIHLRAGETQTIEGAISDIEDSLGEGVTDEEIDAIFDDWDDWEG